MNTPHDRYRTYLETLTPETLAEISAYVTDDVRFKDPFNDTRGVDAMSRVFRHMFENVEDVNFDIHEMLAEGSVCLMAWHFGGKLSGKSWNFDGTSIIRFAEDGRVVEHIDHWDAGRNFYEHLPLIGWLLSAVRRRLSVR
jgi:predicted ester cyclase